MLQRQLLQNNHNFSRVQGEKKDHLRSLTFSEFINCMSVSGADNHRNKKTTFSYYKNVLSIMPLLLFSEKNFENISRAAVGYGMGKNGLGLPDSPGEKVLLGEKQ